MTKGSGEAEAGAAAARYASDVQARSAKEALEFGKYVYGGDKAWREKMYADQLQMQVEQQRRARQQYAQQIQYRHPFVYAGQSATTGLMQLLGLTMPPMPGAIQESMFGKGAKVGFPLGQNPFPLGSTGGGTGGGTGGTGGTGGSGGSPPVDCSKPQSGAIAKQACCAAQPNSVGCKGESDVDCSKPQSGAIAQQACCAAEPNSVGCKGSGGSTGGGDGGGDVDCSTPGGGAIKQAACCAAQPNSPGCTGQSGGGGDDPCAGLGAMGHVACCAVNPSAPSCGGGDTQSALGYSAGGQPSPSDAGMQTVTVTDPNGNTRDVPASLASFYEARGWQT